MDLPRPIVHGAASTHVRIELAARSADRPNQGGSDEYDELGAKGGGATAHSSRGTCLRALFGEYLLEKIAGLRSLTKFLVSVSVFALQHAWPLSVRPESFAFGMTGA